MKLIIVTGASKGLGLAICTRLLKDGYKVIGISRSQTNEFEKLQSKYPEILFNILYDFANTEDIQNLVRNVTKEHGNIYGLINNAALGHDGVLGAARAMKAGDDMGDADFLGGRRWHGGR
jgi:3-oxoacyl-[acyl-carrier protein] reductase